MSRLALLLLPMAILLAPVGCNPDDAGPGGIDLSIASYVLEQGEEIVPGALLRLDGCFAGGKAGASVIVRFADPTATRTDVVTLGVLAGA